MKSRELTINERVDRIVDSIRRVQTCTRDERNAQSSADQLRLDQNENRLTEYKSIRSIWSAWSK
jgi:hypothetical protein